MTFTISVDSNIKKITRRLTNIQRKQIPFATSRSLNDIAFQARKLVVERLWSKAFNVRNKGFPRAVFRVEKSRKKPGPELATPARLFDRIGRDYLVRQATGGTKTARDGRNIAIPGKTLGRGARGVRKGFRPRQALDRSDTFKRDDFIFQRARGGKLKVLYVLSPSARVPKRLNFYEEILKLTRKRFPAIFARNLRNAIRTAR